jgi:hypothetical protein
MASSRRKRGDDWIPQTKTQAPVDSSEHLGTGGTLPKPVKVRATFQIPQELLERARNAVVALASTEQITLAELVEQAIDHEVERLQQEHNRGEAFPRRRRALRPGRPIGS